MKRKQKNMMPQIVVGIVLLAALIGFGLYFNFAVTGQAYKGELINAPLLDGVVDFDTVQEAKVDVSKVEKVDFNLKLTGQSKADTLSLETKKDAKTGLLSYTIKGSNVDQYGLLGPGLSSSVLYLNSDNKSDMELSLTGDVLTFKTLNFVEATTAVLKVFDGAMKILQDDVLFTEKGKQVRFYFNVSSETKPAVTAMLGGKNISLNVTADGEKFVLASADFTLNSTATLKIMAKVGSKTTTFSRILAVDGKIYSSAGIEVVQSGKKVNVTYTLPKSEKLLPLALLCGDVDFDKAGNFTKAYTYNSGKVSQWNKNVPAEANDFNKLLSTGYAVGTSSPVTFTVTCDGVANQGIKLDAGWNFVGVDSITPVPFSEVSVAGKVVVVYEFTADGSKDIQNYTNMEFVPGKVYWVKVQ